MATTVRATTWSVTINNPNAADEESISSARQAGWRVDGQKEVGENGTPHYQLIVKTPQVRFSAVKARFPRAHIEIARNIEALENYVHKDETRVALLAQQSELYPSLQKVWDMFYEWLELDKNVKEFCGSNPDRMLKFFDQFIGEAIEDGYVLETMAVNPQIRSSVKNYGRSIILRSRVRRQTDRQTDERLEVVKSLAKIMSSGYDITTCLSTDDESTESEADVAPQDV